MECAFLLKFNTEERYFTISNYLNNNNICIRFFFGTSPPKVELFTNGPYDEAVKFKSTIEWREELKAMDAGSIIDCRYLDGQWIYLRANTDRELPNCLHWISGNTLNDFKSTFKIIYFSL